MNTYIILRRTPIISYNKRNILVYHACSFGFPFDPHQGAPSKSRHTHKPKVTKGFASKVASGPRLLQKKQNETEGDQGVAFRPQKTVTSGAQAAPVRFVGQAHVPIFRLQGPFSSGACQACARANSLGISESGRVGTDPGECSYSGLWNL